MLLLNKVLALTRSELTIQFVKNFVDSKISNVILIGNGEGDDNLHDDKINIARYSPVY